MVLLQKNMLGVVTPEKCIISISKKYTVTVRYPNQLPRHCVYALRKTLLDTLYINEIHLYVNTKKL